MSGYVSSYIDSTRIVVPLVILARRSRLALVVINCLVITFYASIGHINDFGEVSLPIALWLLVALIAVVVSIVVQRLNRRIALARTLAELSIHLV